MEYQFRNKTGKVLTGLFSASLVTVNNETCILSSIGDITERKQTEEALRESEEKYRNVVERASDGICIIQDKLVKYANSRLAEIRGGAIEEIINTPFISHVHPDAIPMVADHYNRRMAGEPVPPVYETVLRRKDGSKVNAELNVGIIQYQGKPAELAIIRDITERKQMDNEVRKSEEHYRSLFENMLEGFAYCQMIFDGDQPQDFIYLNVNDSFEKLTGLKNVAGRKVSEVIPGLKESSPELFGTYARVALTGQPERIEFYVPQLNIWLDISVHSSERGYFVAVFYNITDLKMFEEEHQRLEKLESVGTLAGGIAHDFNNILTAILGNISLARMEAKAGSEMHDRLEEAEKASLQAKGLTQQLLTFSKGGAPIKKLASVSELLKDTASFALRGSNIKCQCSIPDDLWHAEIDEGQISQVISNLVINARQAMPTGGIMEIRAENMTLTKKQQLGRSLPLKQGDYVRITVADHGIGIPSQYIDNIFDPYFTTKQTGSGLGLATSYSIVRKHDGHISVESKANVGSTFYVYLTASKKKVKAIKKELPVGEGRILVMDDEDMVRDVAGRMLKHIGYDNVEFAADGEEAIKLYREAKKSAKPFAAVILDLTIPGGMGGKEAVKRLLEIDPQVKAIVSSGYADVSVMAEFKEYGFKGMVAKPYTLEQLRKTLHEVFGEAQD